jgi:hypothetical protein
MLSNRGRPILMMSSPKLSTTGIGTSASSSVIRGPCRAVSPPARCERRARAASRR